MTAAIVVTDSVPGGQNVDKVATKVERRVDLGTIEGLSDAARARLQGPQPRIGSTPAAGSW
jgi:protein subunit release factor B